MQGGGGYDIGLSASVASSATSGNKGGNVTIGDTIVGGKKPLAWWVLPAVLATALLLGVGWILK